MKKNEDGFSIVEILIVVVVVGLIGAVGWFVVDRKKPTNSQAPATSQTNTPKETVTNPKQEAEAKVTIQTNKITNKKFTVNLPSDWNYRSCMDHDGLGALVAGAGGDMRCIWTDAKWLEPNDMATKGKVAIGYSTSPYPRQDFSSGGQKDVYESDATNVTLSDGRIAKKYTYTSTEKDNKSKTFKVTEYTVDKLVTVFVFDGHSLESGYINKLSTADVIKIVEETILPSIKLL
jgi:hypothetical protein